ncbi:hypothetical protein MJO28_005482 [Puccinia striiformis f. sp. tritici]|uniref:Uncharacterized protein n=1 Tax=Puccinia striiformis f. sp. tritici TaxID=168172 RepID=A0ACC0EK67_9BASI|nr:hypothetical protein MJO28_005482 [Puccinia striiformis f. sp. tritici]
MAPGLCPVLAIQQRIDSCISNRDSLFGFQTPGGRSNLTKYRVVSRLGKVGRAANARVPIQQICELEQWVSICYKLDIRPYSVNKTEEALDLLMQLSRAWEE